MPSGNFSGLPTRAQLGSVFKDSRTLLAIEAAMRAALQTTPDALQASLLTFDVPPGSLTSARQLVVAGGLGLDLSVPGLATISAKSADVNDYLHTGETDYDGAFARCLAANNHAYVPAIPRIADANNYYHTTSTIAVNSGQSIAGDTAGGSKLVCDTADVPVITLGHNIYWFGLSNLTVAHSVTAVAGGDGLYQGQELTDWVDNCLVSNVLFTGNYNGCNLGKAFAGHLRDTYSQGNVHDGFAFTTTGNADVAGTATGGPLQWVLTNCAAQVNGHDGYSYNVTGSAHGGAGVGSSLGTLDDCVSFSNGHHGLAAYGTAAQPLRSVRIEGGFYGQDAGDGIYLDTYGDNHAICPQFMELAGASNLYITANNTRVTVRLDECTGAWFDGVTSVGATDVMIDGGIFASNGLSGPGGGGLTWAGIRIDGGSADITSIRALDTGGGYQSYGISVTGDNVLISACRLTGNVLGPITWTTGPTNSVVNACMPISINIGRFGDVVTDLLHVQGAAAFLGTGTGAGVTIAAGGLAVTGGVVADNIYASISAGVGIAATGIAGRLSVGSLAMTGAITGATTGSFSGALTVGSLSSGAIGGTTITASVNLVASAAFHANGASSFNGTGVTITSGGLAVTGGVTTDNMSFSSSLYSTAASGGPLGAGKINVAGGVYLNSVAYSNP